MDNSNSDYSECFFNFTNTSGSILPYYQINCNFEKDSLASESDVDKKKEKIKGDVILFNYFDPDDGEYKKNFVRKIKK
jgi:hypothetical protein